MATKPTKMTEFAHLSGGSGRCNVDVAASSQGRSCALSGSTKIGDNPSVAMRPPGSAMPLYYQANDVSIYNSDILAIADIPEESIDLIVTSPPYNVDIHYASNADDLSYDEYLQFTAAWMEKCLRLAKPSGRFCLNIPLDKNKGGQQAVCADITTIAKKLGWRYHSTIIWNEGNISRRTAWGSWMSASAPYVIAPVEVIVVLYKDTWKKSKKGVSDTSKQEFMDWTNGVWTFNGQSKKGAGGHPAPFPIELPRRCIKLFSYVGDVVLDPFLGSGSTMIAASTNGRSGIGVDIDATYCEIAVSRLKQAQYPLFKSTG